jgi:DNA-binding NarL/FixJ family response regulator
MNKIKILIVDDHALFRQGTRALLQNYEEFEIVGEAVDGKDALEKVAQLLPEIVLMDIAMPTMGGLEATRRIQKDFSNVKVLVLTQYQDAEYVLSLLRAGAKGFIAKTATASELVTAIRSVQSGESFLYPTAATAVVEGYLKGTAQESSEYERLTEREREVLQLVAEGSTNQQIADKLYISVKTVLRHRTSIMEKLGFHNRTELIKYAISKGLIEVPRQEHY